jgi:hypothetical protein
VRKMYSAQVHGCKSNMTVTVFQGDKAEEVCLQVAIGSLRFSLISFRRTGGLKYQNILGFGRRHFNFFVEQFLLTMLVAATQISSNCLPS